MSDWFDPEQIAKSMLNEDWEEEGIQNPFIRPAGEDSDSADIHIWCEREDEAMVATYTISKGRHAYCAKVPKDQAIQALSDLLDEIAGDI